MQLNQNEIKIDIPKDLIDTIEKVVTQDVYGWEREGDKLTLYVTMEE
ncbi:hypothetical protein BH18THE2_BH18THE2_39090 [soil metagenome]